MATRIVMRIVYALIALLFVVGVLVFAHIAAWYWLRIDMAQNFYATAGILGGADLVVAAVLAFLASSSSPSRAEQDALEVRRRAVQNIGTTLSITQMAIPVLRMTNNLIRRARV